MFLFFNHTRIKTNADCQTGMNSPHPHFPNFFSSYDVFSSDAVTPLFPPNMFTRQGLKMSKCASWPKHASTCSTDRTIITTIQVNARGEHTPKPIKILTTNITDLNEIKVQNIVNVTVIISPPYLS